MRNADHKVKERARQTFTVPGSVGSYANERLVIGAVALGSIAPSFMGVTALIEGFADGTPAPSGVVFELWLPQVPDGTFGAGQLTDAQYWFSGQVLVPAGVAFTGTGVVISFGSATWALAGYPGAEIRAKATVAGTGGVVTVSVSAF